MTKLLAGTLTVGLIILLAALFIGSAMMRFNLIAIHPAFWLFSSGIVFVLGGGWLVTAKMPGGKVFATLGTLFLMWGGYKAIWPNTSDASSHAQEVADVQAALALNNAVAPKAIRCDRESVTQYWDQVTGLPIVYYILNQETRRIECADRKGFNAFTQQEYKPVTGSIVAIINKQPPKLIPTPEPVQVVVASPPAGGPTAIPRVAVAPTAQPTPEPEPITAWFVHRKDPREYSISPGETLTVGLTEPLDLGERGENFQFSGTLMSNVRDRNGVVLAKSGTPVDMMISSLQLDPHSNEVLLELEVTSLTTTGGTSLPVRARHNGPITVRPVKTGMKKNGIKGGFIGAAVGSILGGLRDGKRGAVRDGVVGTAVGAGAGTLLTKGQYILSPSQLEMTLENRWTVPRTMLADTQ